MSSYRAPRAKPRCADGLTWLRNRLGRHALAPMTGQDRRALEAYLHLLELFFSSDFVGAAAAKVAISYTIAAAQRSVWPLFKAAIPWARDWSDEDAMWPAFECAALDVLEQHEPQVLAEREHDCGDAAEWDSPGVYL